MIIGLVCFQYLLNGYALIRNKNNFFFVDFFSKKKSKEAKKEHYFFPPKKGGYEGMGKTIRKLLIDNEYDLILCDNLSSLIKKEKKLELLRFLHTQIATIKALGDKALFLVNAEDMEKRTIKDIGMLIDGTLIVSK